MDRHAPPAAEAFSSSRNHDLQAFSFVHPQRFHRAFAGFPHSVYPALADRLEKVWHHRAAIVNDSQIGISIARLGINVAVQWDGNDLFARRLNNLDLFLELEWWHFVRWPARSARFQST